MAVRWRCPSCGVAVVDTYPLAIRDRFICASCEAQVARVETLCFVCDAPGALRLRDSLHVQCRVCGETQMLFGEIRAAG